MKNQLSACMLAARMSLWKIAAALAVSLTVQVFSFLYVLRSAEYFALTDLVRKSRLAPFCGLALIAVCFFLSAAGFSAPGTSPGYTLRRLRLAPHTTIAWWMLYNAICLLAFWALELLSVTLLLRYALSFDPTLAYEQVLYLSFYESGFLHGLLPLAETSRWICNGSLVVVIAVTLACNAQRYDRTRRGFSALLLAQVTCFQFVRDVGGVGTDVVVFLCALALTAYQVWGLWGWDYET